MATTESKEESEEQGGEEREEQRDESQDSEENVGHIEEVLGVVIEAVFPDKLPEINHAIKIKRPEAMAPVEGVEPASASAD